MVRDITKPPRGTFVCPECRKRFHATVGKFGRYSFFMENQLHCRDCARLPGFIVAIEDYAKKKAVTG